MNVPKNKQHYSNILALSQDGVPITTLQEKRVEWYIKRGLLEEVDEETAKKHPEFVRVVKFKFKPKFQENEPDEFFLQIVKDRCVVCGCEENLSLHHAIPSCIRSRLPEEQKNHSHGWCVLLCKEHHKEADELALDEFREEWRELEKRIVSEMFKMRQDWVDQYVNRLGGYENLKIKFRDKFLQLNPKFLPEGFLEDHR